MGSDPQNYYILIILHQVQGHNGNTVYIRYRALEGAGPREYFGASRRPPPGSRMRICNFVVSSFGPLGTQALGLIKDIGRRTNLFVPPALGLSA